MKSRRCRALIALMVSIALLAACTREEPPRVKARNVVLITIDALRADAVSYAGQAENTTPNLDALAADSTVFGQAISSFPGTTASMPSLMSGLYPSFEGIEVWNRTTHYGFNDFETPDMDDQTDLTDNLTMLAEILSDHDYLTMGFNTNPHLSAPNNFDQGFDEYEGFWKYLKTVRENRDHHLQGNYPPAITVIDKVLPRLSDLDDRPFFLWLHLMEPHSPYLPPPEYSREFVREPSGRTDLEINEAVYHQLYSQWGATARAADVPSYIDLGLTKSAFRQHLFGLYLGEINYCDFQIQRLMTALELQGLFDDTLIVMTADHGEEFFDHGFVTHHFLSAIAEELIRIPLIIRPPGGINQGRRVDELVRMVDIAPTILDYLGLSEETAGMDGRSLRGVIEGGTAEPEVAFISTIDYGIVRSDRWKYRLEKATKGEEAPVEMLFDIIADPMETTDVAAAYPEVLSELSASWAAFADRLQNRSTARRPTGVTPVAGDELDEATREQLEALGYVDN